MLVLDQYACIYKLHWFTLIKNGSSFFLKIRMETESKWKIKPNEMCHTDRQLLGLSPRPPAHLSLHVSWNYHASWWRQLSLLCQRFTKTPPCKSSYLAAILVFPSFYWMGHFHPQHSVPIQGQPYSEEKATFVPPAPLVAVRPQHAHAGGMAPDSHLFGNIFDPLI